MNIYLRLILPVLLLLGACTPTPTPQQQVAAARKVKPLDHIRPLAMPSTAAPRPTAAAICVMDPKTGRVLYEHNARTRRQVASTQKIITALCVLDSGRLYDRATVTASDAKTPPFKMYMRAGDSYRRIDLVRALMTASYNDVATTLARDTAGSVSAFVDLMNARAARMGMTNSHFANPHGLPANQYSTAYDMALAACWAYNDPIMRRCIDTPAYDLQQPNGKTKRVRSTNKLLKFPWVNGMKTGYTHAARRCLVSAGSIGDQAVIVVVLGCSRSGIWDESLKYLCWGLQIENPGF